MEGKGDELISSLKECAIAELLPEACLRRNAKGDPHQAGAALNQYLARLPIWKELVSEVARMPTTGLTGNELVPYSLRHAYAARARRMGIPDLTAAMNMGHSLQTHNFHYAGTTSDLQLQALARIKAFRDRQGQEIKTQ